MNELMSGQDYSDTEQIDFIDELPADISYREMAARCLERFGAPRAWPADKIASFLLYVRPERPSRISKNPALRRFILDWYGRGGMTIDDLRARCVEKFGEGVVPSRSAIHAFCMKRYKPAPVLPPGRGRKRQLKRSSRR